MVWIGFTNERRQITATKYSGSRPEGRKILTWLDSIKETLKNRGVDPKIAKTTYQKNL